MDFICFSNFPSALKCFFHASYSTFMVCGDLCPPSNVAKLSPHTVEPQPAASCHYRNINITKQPPTLGLLQNQGLLAFPMVDFI